MHAAVPALPPAEAEALVDGLDEITWHQLCDLMVVDQPDIEPGELRRRFARAYSEIIRDLLADRSRKADFHRRRYLVWHLSGGDLKRHGLVSTVARWLEENATAAGTFGFPAELSDRKQRAGIVRSLLAEMRAAALAGAQPYTLSRADEDRLETWLSLVGLDKI